MGGHTHVNAAGIRGMASITGAIILALYGFDNSLQFIWYSLTRQIGISVVRSSNHSFWFLKKEECWKRCSSNEYLANKFNNSSLISALTMQSHIALVVLALTACQVFSAPSRGGRFFHGRRPHSDNSGRIESHESRPHFRWRHKVGNCAYIWSIKIKPSVQDNRTGFIVENIRNISLLYISSFNVSQVSPQLSCGDICQIWTWYSIGDQYFYNSENWDNLA